MSPLVIVNLPSGLFNAINTAVLEGLFITVLLLRSAEISLDVITTRFIDAGHGYSFNNRRVTSSANKRKIASVIVAAAAALSFTISETGVNGITNVSKITAESFTHVLETNTTTDSELFGKQYVSSTAQEPWERLTADYQGCTVLEEGCNTGEEGQFCLRLTFNNLLLMKTDELVGEFSVLNLVTKTTCGDPEGSLLSTWRKDTLSDECLRNFEIGTVQPSQAFGNGIIKRYEAVSLGEEEKKTCFNGNAIVTEAVQGLRQAYIVSEGVNMLVRKSISDGMTEYINIDFGEATKYVAHSMLLEITERPHLTNSDAAARVLASKFPVINRRVENTTEIERVTGTLFATYNSTGEGIFDGEERSVTEINLFSYLIPVLVFTILVIVPSCLSAIWKRGKTIYRLTDPSWVASNAINELIQGSNCAGENEVWYGITHRGDYDHIGPNTDNVFLKRRYSADLKDGRRSS